MKPMPECPTVPAQKIRKKTVVSFWLCLTVLLLIVSSLELLIHPHQYFARGLEASTLFYVWYGFAACVGIVLVSKLLGLLVKVKEDFFTSEGDDG
jgi:hypothetical protein